MLSIGKLAAGQQEYYLRSVAAGVEDYYLGSEAEGRWIGDAASKLDLLGRVTREQLAAVLDGRHPHTGKALAGTARRKLPGWDLTFSAPKSVSLLYALAPAAVQQILVAAHEHAVETGFGYLQREAGFVRRGHNGTRLEPGVGLIGAAFRHRSSRGDDPQLHTHVLLPNLVATLDGQWRTVHSRAFYRHARTAGALYRAALRDSLTQQLGVTWRLRPHALYEIAGIPQPVLQAFSRRRAEIENLLEDRGSSSAKAADIATLATRTAKSGGIDELGLRERWRQRADDLGFDRNALHAVLGPQGRALLDRIGAGQAPSERAPDLARHLAQTVAPPSAPVGQASRQGLDELSRRRLREQLLGPAGLTAQVSVFRRRDVIRAVCDQLPAGAPVEAIESFADEILADRDVIRLVDLGEDLTRFDERTVFSTRELLDLEQRILTTATHGQNTGRAQVPEVLLRIALADHDGLSDEQQRMVNSVCRSGHNLELVVGTPAPVRPAPWRPCTPAGVKPGSRSSGAA